MRQQLSLAALAGGILFLVTACETEHSRLYTSAQRDYAGRDYDAAVPKLARSLRIKPDYPKSQELIRETFPKAVETHLDRIREGKGSAAQFKWDSVVAEYGALRQINEEVKSLPNLTDKKTKEPIRFDVQDYSRELVEAKQNAAEDHYQEGQRYFGKEGLASRDKAAQEFKSANGFVPNYKDGTTLAAEGYYQEALLLKRGDDAAAQKQAAKAFKAALEYVPGYKDAAPIYDDSRRKGVTRIAVIPFQDKSGKGNQYGSVADMIVDGIVNEIMNDKDATEFLEIVFRDQLKNILTEHKLAMEGITDIATSTEAGRILAVQEILTGQITQVSITPERTSKSQTQDRGSVPVGSENYVDKNGKVQERTVWGDALATITAYTRTAGTSISGSCTPIEVQTAKLKNSHQFNGKYQFECNWSRFSGDERVLSKASQEMVNRREEAAPVDTEMVNSAIKDLISSLSSTLKQDVR
jgi:Curli production assembly/transport component CsgG